MPHYYFDWKDGVTKRDRLGFELADDNQAIVRAKELALAAAVANNSHPDDLRVEIIREDGAEIAQVPVPTLPNIVSSRTPAD